MLTPNTQTRSSPAEELEVASPAPKTMPCNDVTVIPAGLRTQPSEETLKVLLADDSPIYLELVEQTLSGKLQELAELHREIEINNKRLEELGLTDAVTGLPNRRAIEVWAPRQLSGAARHGFSFWVVMADLDKFKNVNDSYGNEAGDIVIKRFAHILKANCRASDMCGRMGSEGFLIILSHTNREGVLTFVERIREQMESQRFKFGSQEIVVTPSFGIAEYTRDQNQNFACLVGAAMQSAKRQNAIESKSRFQPERARHNQGRSRC